MHSVIISLGSNLNNRLSFLQQARKKILDYATIQSCSGIYESPPWQKDTTQDFYLNQILQIQTAYSPNNLLEKLLQIETDLGRIRNQKWQARTIDIDILFFDNVVSTTSQLSLPHPFISERRFILLPMIKMGLENMMHPVLEKTIRELYAVCRDETNVIEYKNAEKTSRLRLTKKEIIRNKTQIEQVLLSKKKIHAPHITLHYVASTQTTETQSPLQVLFVVPKRKIKSAVKRNAMKRLLREHYRLHDKTLFGIKSNYCLAFIYKQTQIASFETIKNEMTFLLQQFLVQSKI